jgi:phosphoglycerol transferase MdoB-like AlkP superfamily enzyme
VNWDALDFVVFIALLLAVGVAYKLATRMAANNTYRFGVGLALAASFILIWVNGAVGIIGNEDNEANMLYLGVLAVGIVGAALARFRPRGMARALLATAIAQAAVAIVALVAGWGSSGPAWPADVLVLTAFFVALWLGSALLFRRAAFQTGIGD